MTSEEKQKAIYNAFEPNVPATPRVYADCKEARSGSALVRNMIKRLRRSANENLYYLFTGHLGCGKSSELLHLKDKLDKEETFFPVYIDFEEYLDKQDATLEDIFLGMISEIASQCREKFEIKTKSESYSLFKDIIELLGNIKVTAEAGLPWDIAKINVEKLKQNPSLRAQVREAIKANDKKSLFSELNNFILEIELRLKQETEFTKLVIIADSLEKIKKFRKEEFDSPEKTQKIEKEEPEITSQKNLFIDSAERLKGIAANIIYTVPLFLYRSHYGTQLQQIYGNNVFPLPMVKTHQRGKFDAPFDIGRQELIEIIKKRLQLHRISIDETFVKSDEEETDALKYLIKYSGGNIRTLIRLIQEASIQVDELPIDFRAARESVKLEVRSFAASVREEHWRKLAVLELSADQQIENGDDDYSKLLESLAVLEYMNGDESDSDDEVWYAVNPAIRRTIKFQKAVADLEAERAAETSKKIDA